MDPPSVTAVTPFRFLGLPREVRDDIYEAAIFDLSPPDMFRRPHDPDSMRLRKMDINVLMTSRQVYWESRDVIVRRAQLIMVSIECRDAVQLGSIDRALSGITQIDPMYHNLCVMKHRIDDPTSPDTFFEESIEVRKYWEFILHQQDAELFCRVIMGEFNFSIGHDDTRPTHNLSLHCSSTYGQHEFSSVYAAQTLVLQKYRHILRDLEHTFICGPSIGWENGTYEAVLQDIRSIDDREPTELLDDIRALEQKGSQILLETGDVEASDAVWAQAIRKCSLAFLSFMHTIKPTLWVNHVPKDFETHVQRWIHLKRQHGDGCLVPFLEFWHKLIRHRLSGALRFFEQGHHLATRHGRSPRPTDDYLHFFSKCCTDLCRIMDLFDLAYGSPQPADEAQLCITAAAILRVLNATDRAQEAYRAVFRACELAPEDEPIQQERGRVRAWIRRLVQDGTLERFPSSGSIPKFWFTTFDIDHP